DDINYMSRQRIGLAPYFGSYNELSTWLILERMSMGVSFQEWRQIVRFYFKNVLFELGWAWQGFAIFNFMMHF
ncbi:MAG: hypothetical protein NZ480_06205, partial [Bdellovibrionaceae bacterium]|nr:hypothetical protein [Pseudobdellovibrionaceae bacterium]MDW8190963.1 hypothetical protein [Pseudobdellovibrionaceae bacterium]